VQATTICSERNSAFQSSLIHHLLKPQRCCCLGEPSPKYHKPTCTSSVASHLQLKPTWEPCRFAANGATSREPELTNGPPWTTAMTSLTSGLPSLTVPQNTATRPSRNSVTALPSLSFEHQ